RTSAALMVEVLNGGNDDELIQHRNLKTHLGILRSGHFHKVLRSKLPPDEARAGVKMDYSDEKEDGIITVAAESQDAKTAADWANMAAAAYVEFAEESSRQALRQTRRYLENASRDA